LKPKNLFVLFFFSLCLVRLTPVVAQNRILSLDETMKTLNSQGISSEFRWDPFFGSGVISAGEQYVAFFSAERGEEGPVLFNNREFLNLPLPYTEGGELRFPEAFVTGVKNTFAHLTEDELLHFRIAAIVIDPGHGGKDPGTIGNHVIRGVPFQSIEKDIVLKVSLLLYDKLKTAFPDKRVLLTRDKDEYPTLDERVNLANRIPLKDNEAIIYISIHANASLNRSARGYEIFYLPMGYERNLLDKTRHTGPQEVMHILNDMMAEEFTTESILLAQSILRHFDDYLGDSMPSRGLKEEAWFVVRNAHMPSVLVELGFVTNERDAVLMNDEAFIKKITEALYKGIADFVTLFERSGGFTALY